MDVEGLNTQIKNLRIGPVADTQIKNMHIDLINNYTIKKTT